VTSNAKLRSVIAFVLMPIAFLCANCHDDLNRSKQGHGWKMHFAAIPKTNIFVSRQMSRSGHFLCTTYLY
jgi:hypothetical protein